MLVQGAGSIGEPALGSTTGDATTMAAGKEGGARENKEAVRRRLRERRVPSSPMGRVFGFAQLGASLVYGTVSDSVSQYFRGNPDGSSAPHSSNRCISLGQIAHMYADAASCKIPFKGMLRSQASTQASR